MFINHSQNLPCIRLQKTINIPPEKKLSKLYNQITMHGITF